MSAADQVLELEARRCAAVGAGDLEGLAATLSEDYLHVFGGGATAGREAYVAARPASQPPPA